MKPSAHAKLSRKAGDIIQDPPSESEDITFGYFWVDTVDTKDHAVNSFTSCRITFDHSPPRLIYSCSREVAMAFSSFARFDAIKEGLDLKDALS
jgi:hypothetical protein